MSTGTFSRYTCGRITHGSRAPSTHLLFLAFETWNDRQLGFKPSRELTIRRLDNVMAVDKIIICYLDLRQTTGLTCLDLTLLHIYSCVTDA